MPKPKTIIWKDGEIPFKDICIKLKATHAWLDGVKYILPIEKWIKENNT